MSLPSLSIVIPVKNAEPYLPMLIPILLSQKGICLNEIILMDSKSEDRTVAIAREFESVQVIPEPAFSHGGTRNRGIQAASSERVVLMTQDALPGNEHCLLNLVDALNEPEVAYAFSRHIPYEEARPMERCYIANRFPEKYPKKFSSSTGRITSPEEAFSSNVLSAIKKSVWHQHPFREDLIMGEDQSMSKDLQEAGYSVVYVSDSVVIHSHHYTLPEIFRRHFDSVIATAQVFPDPEHHGSPFSGVVYLKNELGYLLRHHPAWLPYYGVFALVRSSAAFLARHQQRLPSKIRSACSMHTDYWDSI